MEPGRIRVRENYMRTIIDRTTKIYAGSMYYKSCYSLYFRYLFLQILVVACTLFLLNSVIIFVFTVLAQTAQ